MKKCIFFLLSCSFLGFIKGQNTGIGTRSPSHTLHIIPDSSNPVQDPIRIENIQEYTSEADTAVLVLDPTTGVLRYRRADNLLTYSRVFYPPAILLSISATTTGATLDLHQTYLSLYGSPAASSPGAVALPTYSENELYYYVLDFDSRVFNNVSVSELGILTYDVISVPSDNSAYFNVIFQVK